MTSQQVATLRKIALDHPRFYHELIECLKYSFTNLRTCKMKHIICCHHSDLLVSLTCSPLVSTFYKWERDKAYVCCCSKLFGWGGEWNFSTSYSQVPGIITRWNLLSYLKLVCWMLEMPSKCDFKSHFKIQWSCRHFWFHTEWDAVLQGWVITKVLFSEKDDSLTRM